MDEARVDRLGALLFRFSWLYNEKIIRPMAGAVRDTFTPGQFFVLSMIGGQESIAMSELVSRAMMPKQQLTRLVNQLEDAGYVERLRGGTDRRLVRLRATGKAQDFLTEYVRGLLVSLTRLLGALSDEEAADFCTCLERIDTLLELAPKIFDESSAP